MSRRVKRPRDLTDERFLLASLLKASDKPRQAADFVNSMGIDHERVLRRLYELEEMGSAEKTKEGWVSK